MEHLNRLISVAGIPRTFRTKPADRAAIQQQRTPPTHLGFFLAKLDGLPEAVVAYVALQVTMSIESLGFS